MTIKVLIVDDSQFFCRRVGSILNAANDIQVVGIANNGKEAIDKAQKLQPDVITLDVEMPVMDGVTALKQIVKICEARVLMLSSLTYENAKITLDALESGATDFLLKSYESLSSDSGGLVVLLQKKIREIGRAKKFSTFKSTLKPQTATSKPLEKQSKLPNAIVPLRKGNIRVVTIGASTGGPVALQTVLKGLPGNYPFPITVTQHMPGTFTGAFASRLNGLCQLNIVEAEDGMSLRPGHVYIAPGEKQMVFGGSLSSPKVQVRPTDSRVQYSPSVDVTFGSASKMFSGDILAIILTGMGADGTEGCRLIKSKGGTIWAQDEASSVVYGMPMSVAKAGLTDTQLPLDLISLAMVKQVK